MEIIKKVAMLFLHIFLPTKLRFAVLNRIKRTKSAFTSNLELKIFWKIIFFPITLPLSMLIAIFKTVLIWLLTTKKYNDFKYVLNQLYVDIIQGHMSVRLAWKRACLVYELFTKGAEKKVSFGEKNPDKIFYVIRPYYFLKPNELIFQNVANLLTQYYYCLQKLSLAVENNWIPVVDWENYGSLPHSEETHVNGTKNAWNYYWRQPSPYSLEEVYQSKKVILSTRNIGQYGYIPDCAMVPPFNQYAEDLVRRCPKYSQLISFNQSTEEYIEKTCNNFFPKNKRVLGVVVRGSSYGCNGTPYHSHPVQVGMKELIHSVKTYYQEWNMDYIFFVNEMQELVKIMEEEFQENIIILPRMRDTFDRPTDGKTKNPMYLPGNKYQTNLDYVAEVALLSKCTSLIGCMSSGTRSALIWNAGNFENVHIFEKGLW